MKPARQDGSVTRPPEGGQQDRPGADADAGHGVVRQYLCREPWESYYILRRGILPCCHGEKPIAPMADWATAWNSAALQEIRSFLARGELSPYCRRSLGCPIVQRQLERERREAEAAAAPGGDGQGASDRPHLERAPKPGRLRRVIEDWLGQTRRGA
jgi:hypothetical protein